MIALVVDRDRNTRSILKNDLTGRGYEVYRAATAEEALNLCTIIDFTLVVTAERLPEMSGFTLIERLVKGRRDLSLTCIVLVEGRSEALASHCESHAVRAVLNKPINSERLAKCLDESCLYSESNS